MDKDKKKCFLLILSGKIDTVDPYYILVPNEDLTDKQRDAICSIGSCHGGLGLLVASELFGDKADDLIDKYVVLEFETHCGRLKRSVYGATKFSELLKTHSIIDIFSFPVYEEDNW